MNAAAAQTRVTPIGAAEIEAVREYFTGLHTRLSDAWQSLDPASAQRRDEWQRPSGDVLSGNGRLSLIENGAIFDRAGVAFSDVTGAKLPAAASERHTELAGQPFRAMGTSVVVHPVNPYAPTSHANVRLFTARGGEMWWFGGGFDLTPVYPFDEDARDWHRAARAACEPAGPRAYALLKDACDKYFYLPHRGETRGIGGLFADDLNDALAEIGGDFEHCFALIRRIGDTYLDTYTTIVRRRAAMPYGSREQEFQRLRRGRYVEFNLAFDRGTRFGLQSSARTESLLMSLPPRAEWRYDWRPEPGSPEAKLGEYLKPRDWLGP
ncbi:MAG TPA: oxygen-dependent coproporphyrinogen oxidase [Steroidobacteraceae bacterium]|nr:oxygen-dependent coproporphyrinogen oxidase [Steroidobacteraceae bacterium]